jgi:hypothetical protein
MYVRTRDEGLGQTATGGIGVRQTPLGFGNYSGEIRRGPDGRDYRWTQQVDGFGNVDGFWSDLTDRAKKAWRGLVETVRRNLANGVLTSPNITLATTHVSGNVDNANARQNIVDTSSRTDASRSSYGTAPGGTVKLDIQMLASLLKLADTYTFSVSELAGGEHSAGSRHYNGVTVDVNVINGRHVNSTHPDVANFKRDCRSLGATQVLGPGDTGHSTHVHCAWPNP